MSKQTRKKRSKDNLLALTLWSASTLLEEKSAQALQDWLRRNAPQWSDRLTTVIDEEDKEFGEYIDARQRGSLYQVLLKEALIARETSRKNHMIYLQAAKRYGQPLPPPFDEKRLSDYVNLSGDLGQMALYYLFDSHPNRLEQNRISFQVYRGRIDGHSSTDWVRQTMEHLAQTMPIDYAYAWKREEFEAKNIDNSKGSAAIGVDLAKSLPGLYWLNYFGPLYCDFIGTERLLKAPAFATAAVGPGVLVALSESPEEWKTDQYRARASAVEAFLGTQFFFSRVDPNRDTRAPAITSRAQ